MKKLINRIKYWFAVRRYHIDGIYVSKERDGLHLYVEHQGRQLRITTTAIADGDNYTDYGIHCAIKRAQ